MNDPLLHSLGRAIAEEQDSTLSLDQCAEVAALLQGSWPSVCARRAPRHRWALPAAVVVVAAAAAAA